MSDDVFRPPGIAPGLWRAYRDTTYRVLSPHGEIDLRIGRAAGALDRLLGMLGESSWAFVSAANPGSHGLTEAENLERHDRLRREVAGFGLPTFEGLGIGASGDWPAEASLFIAGLAVGEARTLGRRHGQLAIVAGLHGGPPALVSCLPRDADD